MVMMNVFRRKRGHKGKPDRLYTGRYRLPGDVEPVTVSLGVTDKRVAYDKLRELVANEERLRAGLLLPPAQVNAANISLAVHLVAFINDLEARGRTRGYRADMRNRFKRVMVDAGWTAPRDVTRESFTAWRSMQTGKSAKTLNGYLDAVSGLMEWLVGQGKVGVNPMAGVDRVEVRGREVFHRDALNADEFARLLQKAGGNRRALYLVAALTGLRRGTLHRLTWADVVLV